MTAADKALALSRALVDKGALDVRILDLGEEASFTDFFVIATGTSDRHLQTLSDAAVEAARVHCGDRPLGVEGGPSGRWRLVDLGDVVVHLFSADARDFFGLERLWGEGQPVETERALGVGQ